MRNLNRGSNLVKPCILFGLRLYLSLYFSWPAKTQRLHFALGTYACYTWTKSHIPPSKAVASRPTMDRRPTLFPSRPECCKDSATEDMMNMPTRDG